MHARDDPHLQRLWNTDLREHLHLGRVPGRRRNLHPRPDARVRQLRNADLHEQLRVGRVFERRRVRSGADAHDGLRRVLPTDVRDELPVGRLRAASGRSLRVPQRNQRPRVQRVPLRPPVVPEFMSVEHVMYVVLLGLRRVPRAVAERRDQRTSLQTPTKR